MWFGDFQDGCYCGHLGYWNLTILAIQNPNVAPSFSSIQHNSGGDIKNVNLITDDLRTLVNRQITDIVAMIDMMLNMTYSLGNYVV